MAWGFCKNRWHKNSKKVPVRKLRRRKRKGRRRLRWMDDVELGLSNVGVKNGEQEENERLS
jgi:hypothetical protein